MNRSPLRWLPYAFIAALAVAGQYLAGVEHLHPTSGLQQAAILGVALGIEGNAIWLAYLADRRGRLGERALPYRIISALFAALAIGINVAGHYPALYLAAVFGGFSLAGYVVWCIESIFALRDSWDPDGAIRSRVPAYGLLKYYEKDPRVVARARLIAQIHAEAHPDQPGIGPVSALEQARQAIAVDARRTILRKVIREQFQLAGVAKNEVDMALLTYGSEDVAGSLIDRADNAGLAAALLHSIRPARLLGYSDAAWDKVTGHASGNGGRPAERVPASRTMRASRPAGKAKRVPGTGGDTAALERLDAAYQELCDELGTVPSVRALAERADVSRSGAGRWLKAKRPAVPAS